MRFTMSALGTEAGSAGPRRIGTAHAASPLPALASPLPLALPAAFPQSTSFSVHFSFLPSRLDIEKSFLVRNMNRSNCDAKERTILAAAGKSPGTIGFQGIRGRIRKTV